MTTLLVSVTAFIEYYSTINFGLNNLLVFGKNSDSFQLMAASTALCFILIVISITTYKSSNKLIQYFNTLILSVVIGIVLVSVLDKVYSVSFERKAHFLSTMSGITDGLFLLSTAAVILLKPEQGIIKILFSDFLGGSLFRKSVLILVAASILVGYLFILFFTQDSVALEYRFIGFLLFSIYLSTGLIIFLAKKLNSIDYKRQLVMQAYLTSINEKDALFKELHHRIKNNLQMVSSMLYIKSSTNTDSKVKYFINEMDIKIKSIADIHENILQMNGVDEVNIQTYLTTLTSNVVRTYSYEAAQIELEQDIVSMNLQIDKALNLGLICNEIISNAIKYAYPNSKKGKITIILKQLENELLLEINDKGIGLPDEYLNTSTESYGIQLINIFCSQLKAKMNIDNTKGTKYTLQFLIVN